MCLVAMLCIVWSGGERLIATAVSTIVVTSHSTGPWLVNCAVYNFLAVGELMLPCILKVDICREPWDFTKTPTKKNPLSNVGIDRSLQPFLRSTLRVTDL